MTATKLQTKLTFIREDITINLCRKRVFLKNMIAFYMLNTAQQMFDVINYYKKLNRQ